MRNRMREICTSGSVRTWRGRLLLVTRNRVRIGLANARAKGKLIGRKKVRDSELIRKLLKAGMTYRAISAVTHSSHGSISAERAAMRREEEELKRKQASQAEAEKQLLEMGFAGQTAPAESSV